MTRGFFFGLVWFNGTATLYRSYSADKAHAYTVNINQFEIIPHLKIYKRVKIFRAKARRTVRQAKRKSWQSYVSKLNSRSSIKKVWNMVRKIIANSEVKVMVTGVKILT